MAKALPFMPPKKGGPAKTQPPVKKEAPAKKKDPMAGSPTNLTNPARKKPFGFSPANLLKG